MDANSIGPAIRNRCRLCPARLTGLLVLSALLLGAVGAPVRASPNTWLPPSDERGAIRDRNGGESFLLSLEFGSAHSNTLPLTGQPLDGASDADTPALVPLAPPAWAGMAILAILAYTRHKHRRHVRPFHQLA